MDMKDLIQQMTNIESEEKSKKQINEGASMNISMNADDAAQVGQLMAMMRNAGMDPKPVAADMPMPMRKDIDKFRSAVDAKYDDPKIPGKDDVPGDMDLQAGAIGSGIGAGLGSAITGGPVGGALGSVAGGGGLGGAAGSVLGNIAGNAIAPGIGGAIGSALGGAVGGAMNDGDHDDPNIPGKDDVPGDQDLKAGLIGGALGSLAGGAAGNVLGKGLGQAAGDALAGAMGGVGTTMGDIGMQIGKAAPGVGGALAGGMIGDKLTGEADGDYANSPDEKYSSARDVTNPPTNDINKSKKSYPKVAGGDNPMALASRIKEELSALYKEYK